MDERDQGNTGADQGIEDVKALSSGNEADGDQTDVSEAKMLYNLAEGPQEEAAASAQEERGPVLTWQRIRERRPRRTRARTQQQTQLQLDVEVRDESLRKTSRNLTSRRRRKRVQRDVAVAVEKQTPASSLGDVNFISAITQHDSGHTMYRGLPGLSRVRRAKRRPYKSECESDSADESHKEFLLTPNMSSSVIVQSYTRGMGYFQPLFRYCTQLYRRRAE